MKIGLLDFPPGVSPSPLPTIEQTPRRFLASCSHLDLEPNIFESSFNKDTSSPPSPPSYGGNDANNADLAVKHPHNNPNLPNSNVNQYNSYNQPPLPPPPSHHPPHPYSHHPYPVHSYPPPHSYPPHHDPYYDHSYQRYPGQQQGNDNHNLPPQSNWYSHSHSPPPPPPHHSSHAHSRPHHPTHPPPLSPVQTNTELNEDSNTLSNASNGRYSANGIRNGNEQLDRYQNHVSSSYIQSSPNVISSNPSIPNNGVVSNSINSNKPLEDSSFKRSSTTQSGFNSNNNSQDDLTDPNNYTHPSSASSPVPNTQDNVEDSNYSNSIQVRRNINPPGFDNRYGSPFMLSNQYNSGSHSNNSPYIESSNHNSENGYYPEWRRGGSNENNIYVVSQQQAKNAPLSNQPPHFDDVRSLNYDSLSSSPQSANNGNNQPLSTVHNTSHWDNNYSPLNPDSKRSISRNGHPNSNLSSSIYPHNMSSGPGMNSPQSSIYRPYIPNGFPSHIPNGINNIPNSYFSILGSKYSINNNDFLTMSTSIDNKPSKDLSDDSMTDNDDNLNIDSINGNDKDSIEIRRKLFLERNRKAALKCRKRKRERLQILQEKLKEIDTCNKNLERILERLVDNFVFINHKKFDMLSNKNGQFQSDQNHWLSRLIETTFINTGVFNGFNPMMATHVINLVTKQVQNMFPSKNFENDFKLNNGENISKSSKPTGGIKGTSVSLAIDFKDELLNVDGSLRLENANSKRILEQTLPISKMD